jgi:hypothetical protein
LPVASYQFLIQEQMLISIREQTTENFLEETMVKSITTPRKLPRDLALGISPAWPVSYDDLDLYFVNEQYACALGSEVPVAQRSHRDEHRAKIAPDVSETTFVARWRWL